MPTTTRSRVVPAVAAVLGAVSVAVVVGAVRGLLPVDALPRSQLLVEVIPHLNAVVSLLAIATIAGGVRAIRRGDVRTHRRRMLAGFGLFVVFLVAYLYKVALAGPTPFGSDGAVYTFVYLPVLAIHMILAILALPLLYYVLLLAFTTPVADLPDTPHPTVGRVTAVLWIVSFVLGLVVYAMLYLL